MLPPSIASAKTVSKWFRPAADLGPSLVDTILEEAASCSAEGEGVGLGRQTGTNFYKLNYCSVDSSRVFIKNICHL